jgi:hypothetical protein
MVKPDSLPPRRPARNAVAEEVVSARAAAAPLGAAARRR